MPRKSASPKRKRYSLPVAGDTTLERIDEREGDVAPEETQSRKRGRPSELERRDVPKQREEADAKATNGAPRRKRGRRSLEERSEHVPYEHSEEHPRKRGRPAALHRQQPTRDDDKPKRKRGRPSLSEKSHSELNEGASAAGQSEENQELDTGMAPEATKSKRGRPKTARWTRPEDEEVVAQGEVSGRGPKGASQRGQGRQQQSAQGETEQPQGEAEKHDSATRKRGRPKKNTPKQTEVTAEEEEEEGEEERGADKPPPSAKRKRGRPSLDTAKEPSTTCYATTSRPSGEVAEERGPDDATQNIEENLAIVRHYNDVLPRSHPRLVPKDRTLSKSEIEEKWAPLPSPALEAAAELLVPAGHATINALPLATTRRRHTEAAIAGIQKRLMAYAGKVPFPLSSSGMRRKAKKRGALSEEYEPEFDYEYVYNRITSLQAQLDAAQCAVEVLQRERDKEERALERDYKILQSLQAGAKAEKRDAREMIKKAHVLAPEGRRVRYNEKHGIVVDGKAQPSLQDLEDDEVKGLAMQLSGHMDSMQTNMAQLDGLTPQLERSSAALRSVLARHLSGDEYHRVLFG